MAITVKAIHEKEFKYKMRGYDDVEVDDFLDEVAEEFERLAKEVSDLKKNADHSGEQVGNIKSLETTLRDTLVTAHRTADEMVREAQNKANAIIANAEKEAENIVADARNQTVALKGEFQALKQRTTDYINQQRMVLTNMLNNLESKAKELGQDITVPVEDYLPEEPPEEPAMLGEMGGFGEPQGDGDMGDTIVFKNLRV